LGMAPYIRWKPTVGAAFLVTHSIYGPRILVEHVVLPECMAGPCDIVAGPLDQFLVRLRCRPHERRPPILWLSRAPAAGRVCHVPPGLVDVVAACAGPYVGLP